jgi:eukaryotic-like serine/threonine-protein kinase
MASLPAIPTQAAPEVFHPISLDPAPATHYFSFNAFNQPSRAPASGMSSPAIPLGAFHLDRCIGRGGMAEVWSGVHAAQRVPVAVKVMTAERAREASFRAAFRNEVQAVASLDHPGIVRVFDHGEVGADGEEASRGLLTARSPILAMELADGTLASLFVDGITWPAMRQVLLDLLDALAHAHAHGVVHRDLKPNNILVFRDGGMPRLKLADFGLAQAVELQSREDSTEVICGTPSYMAPEQLRGHWRDYGSWTDLYALGCLAWTLATGKPAFGGTNLLETFRLQMESDPPGFEPRISVPHGFEGWLRRLLQKEAGRRYVRAADAAAALLDLDGATGAGDNPGIGIGVGIAPAEPTTESISFSGLWPLQMELRTPGAQPGAQPGEPPLKRSSPPLPATWEHPEPRPPSIRLIGAGLGLYGLRSIPLLGRRAERDALWQALAAVHAERRARLVLLRGPAGNGKTHLAEWLAERSHEVGGAIVLRASHGPNPGAEHGLPRMMARHLRCGGLSREEIRRRTEILLRARKETDPAEWDGLTELMAPESALQTAPERFGLIERYFQRLARQRPVLALFDDVQWGAESVAFAHHLLERRKESPLPVLLLLTTRDEAIGPAEEKTLAALLELPGAESLTVPPLPREEGRALIREVLGLDGDLAAQVEARTGGNPLFAVQLVGDWVQRGVIEVGDTGFVLRPGAEALIPDDLHQVWAGRVARLLEGQPPGARDALEIAATLSPFVDRREWESACRAAGIDCPIDCQSSLLEELVTSRLALRTEEGWSFVHAMLRESVERMARDGGRLAGHHRACAAMLRERRTGARGVAERLGRHLLLAGEREAALEPLLTGARERRETSDYPAALTLLADREAALEELGAPAADPRRGKGWVVRARIHLHQGELAEVFRWAERAETAGGEDWGAILSESLRLQGDAARRRGDLDGAAHLYERCIALPENPHGAAASLWGLADVARQRGRTAEARTLFDRALLLYRAIGDEHGIADHTLGQADLARQRRDLAGAEDLYRRARDRFEALGNRYGVARGTNGLGEVARMRGDLVIARECYARSLSLLEELRSADAVFPRLNLALIHLAEARFRDAQEILEESREILERWGWGGLLAVVHVGLLSCAADARDWSAWDDHLDRSRAALGTSTALDPDIAACAELGGRLMDWAGQDTRARVSYGIALAQWRGLGDERGVRRMEKEVGGHREHDTITR